MATASSSRLTISVEKTNGHKLSRLLIDGGTTVLRNHFDHYHPPVNLAADLHANLSILSNLRRRRILNDSQWDKLFPPTGGPPDSNTFDITLLFLLLTNICGLSPPLSGIWHKMPPASDTTLAANLARIKCYRNELYGHVTTTGIQTPVFNFKWQEVSSVLVLLGLSQSEVNRLKREPCGEDYVRAITEWMKNDEEILFQLREVLQKQEHGLQSQREDHRTLQHTHQTVSKVQQMQMEASKLQQEEHRTLQDTHQTVSKVQQMQMEASKLQEEDHRTLQDTHQTVSKVQQVQMEASKLQREDHRTLQHIHQAVEDVRRDAQHMVEVSKTQQETQQQVRNEVLNANEKRHKDKDDEALRKLAEFNTETLILSHSKKYQEGTRFSKLENIKWWIEDVTSENRVMVISGDAGMGKSVMAAVVCQRIQQAGRLAGSHFCRHSHKRDRNPKLMLQSLALQLCEVLPRYEKEIVKTLSRNLGEDINDLEVGELFELLFEEPLRSVGDPGKILLIVIDGLDESEYKGRNEVLDVIADHFCTLPVWLRFLVTTRPEINIADHLRKFNPLQLEQNDEENIKDIKLFLEKQLSNVIQSGCEEIIISELVRKAAGHILYAYLMVKFIKEKFSNLTPEMLGRTFPSGLSSVYQSYFERLEKELQIGEEQFLTFLSALAAAREPLPLEFVSTMLLSDTTSLAGDRKVRKAVASISTLIPVQDGRIHFFHKSVKDWLVDSTAYGKHNFSVDQKKGHLVLSQLCTDELNGVKEKGVHSTEFSDTMKYALQHGVHHMLESEEGTTTPTTFQEIVKNYVIDFDVVYAKLCVNKTVSSEDIIRVQKEELFEALSCEIQGSLGTLLFLLRKYLELLSTRPSEFFQLMVNKGGDVLASKAKELLQNKYCKIPYMVFVEKPAEKEEVEETRVQAVFHCMSKVTCFDISPRQEFMVCECMDGSIQLWSLQTGKLMWKRPVKVEKCYVNGYSSFRLVPNSSLRSCYRSVVFHSTQPIVLPGILSHAYSIDGDLLPLFPKSNCRFDVCSVYGDRMITGSSDDAKCLVMWNLQNGEEISRTIRNEVVLSFAWSPDGKLLAIFHLSGLVCLVDVLNCFQTLSEVSTPEPCEAFMFFRRDQSLFCLQTAKTQVFATAVDIIMTEGIRLNVVRLPFEDFSWDFLDRNLYEYPRIDNCFSKGGFLMGDPTSEGFFNELGFLFVLNKQSEVRGFPSKDYIEICSPLKLISQMLKSERTRVRHLAFALDGKTIHVVTDGNERSVVSFNVSSGESKEFRTIGNRPPPTLPHATAKRFDYDFFLVPVTKGVVLKLRHGGSDVELWNFELSQIVRSWPSLWAVTYIMPFSDQCVACVGRGFEVSILDTSSGDIVKTIPLCHEGYESTYPFLGKEAIVCNSEYKLLSTDRVSIQLSDGKGVLWRRPVNISDFKVSRLSGMFSPKENFILVAVAVSQKSQFMEEVLVLDATLGRTLRKLCTVDEIYDCAFVSNTECVISCRSILRSYFLQLFDVRTGDLLSLLETDCVPSCLASFPQNGLIAIGHSPLASPLQLLSVIEVKMPRDEVKEEAKDLSPTDDDDDGDSDDAGDNDGEDDNEFDMGSAGENETTEEQELPQQILKIIREGSVGDMDAPDSDEIRIHQGTVTSEGAHWALPLGAVHLIFPPNAVSEPTSVEVHRWKYSVRSPPLQEHEAITSNVIELSSTDGQDLKFNTKVTLSLSHSATDLRGYEIVIKRLIDKEENKWEDLDGTRDVRCRQGIEDRYPDNFFPVAQTDITECSTYAVVCRLKSSPIYTITSNGGSFSHPDFPGVTITVPENAVAPNANFHLQFKVQEVPNDEFQEEGAFLGPILRISCFEVIQFLRPVTIQLPISLRGQQDLNLDLSKRHVRVFFVKSDDEKKEWIEITGDLVRPPSFDEKFVQFKVKGFSWFSYFLDSSSHWFDKLRITSVLKKLGWFQPRPAVFMCYFYPNRFYSLYLTCCHAHLQTQEIQRLKEKNITPTSENSMKDMVPGQDKAFVFISGRIRPLYEKDMENISLTLIDDDRKSDNRPIVLEVDLVNNQDSARVEFHNTSEPAGNASLLCQLHVPMPSQNASSITDHARSYARKPLRVISLGDEWGSSKGGLSTLNRELAKHLAQQPDVTITLLLPCCSDKDKQEASDCNVSLATPWLMPGFDPIKGLSFPRDDLDIDVVIGHGRKFGTPAQAIARQRKCKRVHFVHTASEELAMFKTGDKTISEGGINHRLEKELCEKADIVVAIGPKLKDDVSANLRACGKDEDVINITPGVFSEFLKVRQASKENENFRILMFGRGDPEDFELKGYDIAARAVKSLENQTYILIFVGALEGEEDKVKDKLLKYGISRDQLRVRRFIDSRESLEKLFCEMDLALMPSRTEGYGLTALEALSAGLPILVSENSGFGKVVQALPFGDSVVVGSDDADKWGKAIERMRNKPRETRLKEARSLRQSYDELYKWETQCKILVEKMQSLFI